MLINCKEKILIDMNEVIKNKYFINTNDIEIASGDLANEIGKKLMQRLEHSIKFHRDFQLDRIYFITMIKKDPTNLKEINIYIKASRQPLRILRESVDLWEYDYREEKLNLIWSLPHRTEMKNFLRSPEKYNKDLISWIKAYVKQENINLNDPSSRVISS